MRHLLCRGWRPAGPSDADDADKRAGGEQFVVQGRPQRQSEQRALSHQGKPSFAGRDLFSSFVVARGHGGLSTKYVVAVNRVNLNRVQVRYGPRSPGARPILRGGGAPGAGPGAGGG